MATKRKSFDATFTRTEAIRRRSARKRKSAPPRSGYGPIFFIVMGVTIASALGFLGVVASVLAGG